IFSVGFAFSLVAGGGALLLALPGVAREIGVQLSLVRRGLELLFAAIAPRALGRPADTSKTEETTPAKHPQARGPGQIAPARDGGGHPATLAARLLVTAAGPAAAMRIHDFATRCFREPFDVMNHDTAGLSRRLFETLGLVVFPVAAAATIGGLIVGFAEA